MLSNSSNAAGLSQSVSDVVAVESLELGVVEDHGFSFDISQLWFTAVSIATLVSSYCEEMLINGCKVIRFDRGFDVRVPFPVALSFFRFQVVAFLDQ